MWILTRGPGATSLTWVILANILHMNTCKVTFYWNWFAGTGEDFFQCKHVEIWFSLLWPLPTPMDHGLYKLESTLYQKAFKWIWALLDQCFWRKRFLIDPTPFLHFCDYLPFKRIWPLICTILNSLYLKMICTKFYWNWPAASGEEDFFFNINT
jgi:hypothetical protein